MKLRPMGSAAALALFACCASAQTTAPGATMPNGANVPGANAPSSGTPGAPAPGATSKGGLPPAPAEVTGPPVPPGGAGLPARRPGTDAARMAPPATTQTPSTRARAHEAFDCGRIADRAERTRCVEQRDRPASAPR